MLIKTASSLDGSNIAASEITPRHVFENRRALLKLAVATAATPALAAWAQRTAFAADGPNPKLAAKPNGNYVALDKPTPYTDATTYNNFYEFGTDKANPARNASTLKTEGWTLTIEGMVNKPITLDLDALKKLAPLEERIYRLRCVEGWSMVIPWIGYSLSELIKKVEPTSSAKYVEFISLADVRQMPFLGSPMGSRVLDWPYVEGLRLDEANHPLALLTLGMYGEVLPKQNGAPVRMVVPWKYGFKSPKSIIRMRFTDKQPQTAWNKAAPQEYGFYSNVNPTVDHPRWSQASERRIGEGGVFTPKKKTLMFNGYEQVAGLYSGMDLAKFF
ncbi:protein-methionine-sulfoxide reductase catalytic subunit MsrP [Ampullimonas aquatilis]|uniref:protein-methionine-sulfoxide reductase catalytic subunit MsrP n=1 Tax=Ampullimonas aquatilis TaxID=1341549 RepID=UPI003C75A499